MSAQSFPPLGYQKIVARDIGIRAKTSKAEKFRPSARTTLFDFRTLTTSPKTAGTTVNPPSHTNITRKTSSSPLTTPPQKWRTSAASLSTCKARPSTHEFLLRTPRKKNSTPLLTYMRQLRPPQVQRNEPHHQGQGPRFRADFRRQGRRERPLHRREPDVCALRVRARHGRERRLHKPPEPEGWVLEECVECEPIDGTLMGWAKEDGRIW